MESSAVRKGHTLFGLSALQVDQYLSPLTKLSACHRHLRRRINKDVVRVYLANREPKFQNHNVEIKVKDAMTASAAMSIFKSNNLRPYILGHISARVVRFATPIPTIIPIIPKN